MGRLHKADDPLTGFGFCQAWCELLGLEGFWRCDIRFGGNLTNLAWLHPQGLEELTHWRRPTLEPRQVGNPRAVVRQLTPPPMQGPLLEFFDAAFAVLMEVAVEGRGRNGAQATDFFRRQTLTLQVKRLQFALHPRVRMVQSPGMQRFPLGCGQLGLVHRRASG